MLERALRFAPLAALTEEYAQSRGLHLVQVAGGYQIVTRPEFHEWVRRLFHERTTSKLSVAALETLAVIAYRQPVTVPEIGDIRGVNASGVISTLVDRKLIKIVGRKAVVGRPFMYGTTREFLERFIPEVTHEALGEAKLVAVVPPSVTNLRFTPGQPLSFEAVVDVAPTVEVKDWKGYALKRRITPVAAAPPLPPAAGAGFLAASWILVSSVRRVPISVPRSRLSRSAGVPPPGVIACEAIMLAMIICTVVPSFGASVCSQFAA